TVPANLGGNYFLSGLADSLTAALPAGISPITWSGVFTSTDPGVDIQWQWAASVYTKFSSDHTQLGVKACDDGKASAYLNGDHAGSPQNFKAFVTGGARGGGGSNYTGSYSPTM